MLPLLFLEQGATAPVGNNGGISVTAGFNSASQPTYTATAWYGGTLLKAITHRREADALQNAIIVLSSYIANFSDVDPDN